MKTTNDDRATDALRMSRPEWMDEGRWAEIRSMTVAYIDERVAEAKAAPAELVEGVCAVHAWCTMSIGDDHAGYHASDPEDLVGPDGGGATGWWCWIVQEDEQAPEIRFENPAFKGTCAVPASLVAVVLAASATPESRAALGALVELIAG